jgi:glycosyltransferase involved in cell wall biosynthesis
LRPDIVHLHTSKAAAVGRLAWGVPSGRIVYTMHGFGQLQVANARLLKVDRALNFRAGAVVAVSDADRRTMTLAGYRPRLIRNGCPDMKVSRPLDPVTAADLAHVRSVGRPVFLMAAREAPPKRVDLARQAAVRLGGRATILWAGGEAQGSDPAGFVALGVVDVRALLSRVDGFLLVSDHEGLPMSLLEALSAGLPCVASAIPGCMEVLGVDVPGPGAVGMAVPNTADDIAATVAALAEDPQTRSRMGEAARLRWAQLYSEDEMVSGYEALYRDLITHAPEPGAGRRS